MIGSSMAMVATGPMPGSTPIRVPSRHPARQKEWILRRRRGGKPDHQVADDVHVSRSRTPGSAGAGHRRRRGRRRRARARCRARDRLLPFHVGRREGAGDRHDESGELRGRRGRSATRTGARRRESGRLGYHRPASIGGPSTATARNPITAPRREGRCSAAPACSRVPCARRCRCRSRGRTKSRRGRGAIRMIAAPTSCGLLMRIVMACAGAPDGSRQERYEPIRFFRSRGLPTGHVGFLLRHPAMARKPISRVGCPRKL